MIRRVLFGMLAALVLAAPAGAGEPAAFTTDSLAKIKAQYAGRPFILNLWSVNECSYCIAELTLLGKLAKTQKRLPLVLVATDTPDYVPAMQKTLAPLGLGGVDSWVFDDPIPERLRHAIDPSWYGELPRTYLYDAQHQRETVVGVLSEQRLRAWLRKHKLVN
ncbi:redoxin domain-containing protein [Thiobacillus sp.]|uniref:TlpA family protein disulfide reductase n=1 Tax=Thiobacillus sp. TaxID=924 RepID=UPI0025F10141|nr:redoxin domain-containing protein [Thiobacillus sp.]